MGLAPASWVHRDFWLEVAVGFLIVWLYPVSALGASRDGDPSKGVRVFGGGAFNIKPGVERDFFFHGVDPFRV